LVNELIIVVTENPVIGCFITDPVTFERQEGVGWHPTPYVGTKVGIGK